MTLFPTEDRRLALAFLISTLFHFAALNTGAARHATIGRRAQTVSISTSRAGRAMPPLPPPQRAKPQPSPELRPPDVRSASRAPRPGDAEQAPGDSLLAIPGLPSPYHSILDLTRDPRFEGEIPEFLPLALSQGEGKVFFVLYLDEDGTLDRLESSSQGANMDFAVRYLEQMIRTTPIAPGEIDGEPVRTRWVLEFSLSPGGVELEQASSSVQPKP